MFPQAATGVSSSQGTISVSTTPSSASSQTVVVQPPVLKVLDPMGTRDFLKASIEYDPFKDSLATRICKLVAHLTLEGPSGVFLALFHQIPTLTCADPIELLDNVNAAIRKFESGYPNKETARDRLSRYLADVYDAFASVQATNTKLQIVDDPVLLLIKGMEEALLPAFEGKLPPSVLALHEAATETYRKTVITLAGEFVILKARPVKAQKEKKQASSGEVKEKEKQKPAKKEKAHKEDKAKKAEKPEKEQRTEPESKDEGTVKEEKVSKQEKKKRRKSMPEFFAKVGGHIEDMASSLTPSANPVASPRRKPSYKAHMDDLLTGNGKVRGGPGPNFQGNFSRENALHEPDAEKANSTPRTPSSPRGPGTTASTPSTSGTVFLPSSAGEREKAKERKGKSGDESSDQ